MSFSLFSCFVVFVLTIKILVNFAYLRRAVIVDHEARIRERRGALLFALKEESAAKVNRRRFLSFTLFRLSLTVDYLAVTWRKSDGRREGDVARSDGLMKEDR